MQLFKKIASNTFWQIVARVVSSGISFVITIVIARTLGVTGYGDLAKITAFVSLFYLFVDLGLNAIFLQLDTEQNRFRDLLSFRLLLAVGVFCLIGIVALFLPFNLRNGIGYSPLVKVGILLFGLTFFSRAIVFSTAAVFQLKYQYKLTAYATVLGSLATLGSLGIFLVFHPPFLFIVGAYVIGALIEALFSLFFLQQKLFPLSLDKTFIKDMTLQTLPIAAMLLLNLIYFRVDMFFLSVMKPTQDVAIYDFAYKFFDFLIALPLFLSNSFYPMLLDSEKNMRTAFPKLMVYLVGFAFLGVLTAFPTWFAASLLGFVKPEFAPATLALRLLVLSLPIFFATSIIQWIFIAKKKQQFLLSVYASSLVLNVVLNLLFIPHYSYVASAIITGVSETGVLAALLGYSLFGNL